jgi:uncharacterized protein (TIGR02996 family)
MSDEDGFLRKLLEKPADDTVRLVYSDWLEERNEPLANREAEFLRLEAELREADETMTDTFPRSQAPPGNALSSRLCRADVASDNSV